MNKCPNCGANLMDNHDYKFCPYCAVEIPKPEPQKTINIYQTNQNSAYIQEAGHKTPLDKFFEHRQAIKSIKMEKTIEKEENARLIKERENRMEADRQLALAEERRKKAEQEERAAVEKAEIERIRREQIFEKEKFRHQKNIHRLVIVLAILVIIILFALLAPDTFKAVLLLPIGILLL